MVQNSNFQLTISENTSIISVSVHSLIITTTSPGEFQGNMLHHSIFHTPFGNCLTASTDHAISNILFFDDLNAGLQEFAIALAAYNTD